jgi:hypothetical protein
MEIGFEEFHKVRSQIARTAYYHRRVVLPGVFDCKRAKGAERFVGAIDLELLVDEPQQDGDLVGDIVTNIELSSPDLPDDNMSCMGIEMITSQTRVSDSYRTGSSRYILAQCFSYRDESGIKQHNVVANLSTSEAPLSTDLQPVDDECMTPFLSHNRSEWFGNRHNTTAHNTAPLTVEMLSKIMDKLSEEEIDARGVLLINAFANLAVPERLTESKKMLEFNHNIIVPVIKKLFGLNDRQMSGEDYVDFPLFRQHVNSRNGNRTIIRLLEDVYDDSDIDEEGEEDEDEDIVNSTELVVDHFKSYNRSELSQYHQKLIDDYDANGNGALEIGEYYTFRYCLDEDQIYTTTRIVAWCKQPDVMDFVAEFDDSLFFGDEVRALKQDNDVMPESMSEWHDQFNNLRTANPDSPNFNSDQELSNLNELIMTTVTKDDIDMLFSVLSPFIKKIPDYSQYF